MTSDSTSTRLPVKRLLYPLTPLEHCLEWLIECLPRRNLAAQVRVSSASPVRSLGQGAFLGESDRPELEVLAEPPGVGWCYLEAALGRNTGSREAFLVVTLADGEIVQIPVPSNLRGSVREVFHVPESARGLAFIPTAARGFFTIAGFEIHRISRLEAWLRQGHRVLIDWYGKGLRLPVLRVGASVFAPRGWLHACYTASARQRLAGGGRNNYQPYMAAQERARCAMSRSSSTLVTIWASPQGWDAASFAEGVSRLQRQRHTGWELMCPTVEGSGAVCASDPRIRPLHDYSLEKALAQAQGEWIFILEPGMSVAPDCLEKVLGTAGSGSPALIYTDEDRLGRDGLRCDPIFKPAWNPELHLSDDYIGCACFYRTQDVRARWQPGLELTGAVLRLVLLDRISPERVIHIPQVLVHGRGADRLDAQSRSAWVQSVLGPRARVSPSPLGYGLHIRYPLPGKPLVSVIIPTRNGVHFLRTCIESLLRMTDYDNIEVLVADNQSSDPETLDYLARLPEDRRIRVIRCDFSFNFSRINNELAALAAGDFLVFLNNDTEVISPGWLEEMIGMAAREDVGVVGARLLYGNGLIQHAGVIVGIGGAAGHWFRYLEEGNGGYQGRALLAQNLSAVTGACMALRKDVFLGVGGFDQAFAVAYNDVDLCLRVAASGLKNVYTPHAVLLHHESVSRGRDDTPEKKKIFQREYALFRQRWAHLMAQGDPAYSPNLSVDDESCSFARVFRFEEQRVSVFGK